MKKLASRFFKWYCHPNYYEDIKGDLDELHMYALQNHSKRKANWQYTKEILLLFRPSIIRPIRFINIQYTIAMLQNHLKIGMRHLMKHRANTFIHILGLAIGLTAFLLINQYVVFEKSYDRFHPKANQLYRLTTDVISDGVLQTRDAMTYAPAAKAVEEALPEVIASTTTLALNEMNFRRKEKPFQEDLIAVDSNFLNLFPYKLLAGDPNNLFQSPYSMVLTESHAKKYFGDKDPVGQTIEYLSSGTTPKPFQITGVIADLPENTHYKFNMLVSISTLKERLIEEAWNNNNYYSYVLLDKNADISAVNKKLPALSKQLIGNDSEELLNLQAVTDIHLRSTMSFEPSIHGSQRAINFLFLIAIFILLIAWINYINLSTARAVERAKEVGIRKVVGGRKVQLMGQFFIESLLVNFFGMVLAILLVQWTLPYFNQLVGKTVMTNIGTNPYFLRTLFIFFCIGTLVTGIYPSLVLSYFHPIEVLKGSFSRTKHGIWLRKGLVIFQFAASFVLIAGTLIVYRQLQYMLNKEMGMKTSQVLSFNNPDYNGNDLRKFLSHYKSFQENLKQHPEIKNMASINSLPGGKNSDISSNDGLFSITGESTPVNSLIYLNFIDDQVVDALNLKVVAGRNLNFEMSSDSSSALINMAMLKLLNIPDPESVIGKQFVNKGSYKFRIVGILDDFNRSSLKHQIEPTLFIPKKLTEYCVVKLDTKDVKSTISKIEKTYLEFFPSASFNPIFLDQRFEKLYNEDRKFGSVFTIFSSLTIFVAIMGLFGLASFLSIQRTKEVGIRKVLGASIPQIIFMLFKDFIWLVGFGLIIGAPIIYWGMTEWLNGYAFRINFPWSAVVVAIIVLTVISFITVSFHSYKTAITNPVDALKME